MLHGLLEHLSARCTRPSVIASLKTNDPPGAPYIEGYAEGETVRRGQNIELVCRSRGGNPPAQLIWYKNGEQIRMAYSKEIDASQTERLGRSCLSIVPRSRSHARFRQNATMSHAFSCVQPAFIDL
ncbi:Nephrin [Eumeta japonica]|uniref:Nephrin n=1 Tax=Eumeta variegata TaxID=151549 RepID=A0A4C1Y2J8_EUMVA|nr:Nephrin [Eumeta japonica]